MGTTISYKGMYQGLYRDNGKENGNYYLGFRVSGLRASEEFFGGWFQGSSEASPSASLPSSVCLN